MGHKIIFSAYSIMTIVNLSMFIYKLVTNKEEITTIVPVI